MHSLSDGGHHRGLGRGMQTDTVFSYLDQADECLLVVFPGCDVTL